MFGGAVSASIFGHEENGKNDFYTRPIVSCHTGSLKTRPTKLLKS